jgi:hypothetical protein
MFKLRNLIVAKTGSQKIVGTLVGIDSYEMNNFEGKTTKWTSYTLTSNHKGAFSRYWIIDRGNSGWFISVAAKPRKIKKNMPVVLARSGLAQIAFKGDKGPSSPSAALLAYKIKKGHYYTIECFSKDKAMYFSSQKISKPTLSAAT